MRNGESEYGLPQFRIPQSGCTSTISSGSGGQVLVDVAFLGGYRPATTNDQICQKIHGLPSTMLHQIS
jgi:hypothetical protein